MEEIAKNNETAQSGIGVSCRFCKYFKEDVEYSGLGMCQNEQVIDKLIFSFCNSFMIDADFACKWFSQKGR